MLLPKSAAELAAASGRASKTAAAEAIPRPFDRAPGISREVVWRVTVVAAPLGAAPSQSSRPAFVSLSVAVTEGMAAPQSNYRWGFGSARSKESSLLVGAVAVFT